MSAGAVTATVDLDVDGPAAPPRANGELVFAEPWESRAFGMAVTLHEAGAFGWEAFRDRLVAQITAWERDHGPGEQFSYYRCWLAALEDVLDVDGTVARADLETRADALAARPAGHDHGDDDDEGAHDHGV